MKKIYAHTGTYMMADLGIEIHEHDDILKTIDEKVSGGIEKLNCSYSTEECDFYCIPINGGQYWIPQVELR